MATLVYELDSGRIPDSFPVVFAARHSLMGTGLALETAKLLSCPLLSCRAHVDGLLKRIVDSFVATIL